MIDQGRGQLYLGDRLIAPVTYRLESAQTASGLTVTTGEITLPDAAVDLYDPPQAIYTLRLANGRSWACFAIKRLVGLTYRFAPAADSGSG